MVNIREYLVDWTGAVSGLSVLYGLQSAANPDVQQAAIAGFLDDWMDHVPDTVVYSMRQDGKVLDSADASLQAGWTNTNSYGGIGGLVGGEPSAQATQVYCRFATGVIRGNRNLAGGIYLPGLDKSNIDLFGELGGTVQTSLNAAGAGITGTLPGIIVWGRPRPNSDGSPGNQGDGVFGVITSVLCREELSVQRNRRRA